MRLRRKECKEGKKRGKEREDERERREIIGQRNTAAAVIIAY